MAAGKIRLIGAVGVKVRPDTSDFKEELRAQIKKLPEYEIELDVDGNTDLVEKAIKKAKQDAEKEPVTLRVGLDYDGVKRAKAQVDGMLKSLNSRNTEIPVELTVKGLAKAQAELNRIQRDVKVDVKYSTDEAGYRSVLSRIAAIRRDKITKQISFKTDAKSLREEERKAEKALRDLEAKKTITLRYDNNWDGINGAIDNIERRLADLRQLKIKTKLDKASLEDARNKLQKKLETASVTMKYNEDEAGYQAVLDKIRQIQRQKLAQTIKFKTDDESLKAEAEKFEKLLQGSKPKRMVEVSYTNDRSSLEQAIATLDSEIAKLEAHKLKVEADPDALRNMRDSLQIELNHTPLTMKINEDKEGYTSVLKKIRALQAERIAKTITFETDDATLAAEATKYEALLEGLQEKSKLKLTVNSDATNLATQIAKIDAALAGLGDVEVEVEMDEAKLRAKRAELEGALVNSKFEVKYDVTDVGSLERAKAKISDMLAEKRLMPLEVHPTEESMREALQKIEQLRQEAERNKIKLETEATGLGLMSARLAVASRSRVVPFYVRINEKSLLVAEGMLKSLSGSNTLTSLGNTLEGIFTKFDTYVMNTGALATAVGSLVDTGAYVATTLFSIGEGISQSIGLLATAPAAVLTMSAGLFVFTAAFNNFSNAFSDDAKKQKKAMEELPPNARKAVDALRGVYKQIATPVQNAFWVPMGDAISRAKDHLLPQLTRGLEGLATGAGKFTAGVIDSFTEISQDKQIETLFKNMTLFFDETGKAAKPFFDGFNQFGIQGSKYLPQFGTWLKDMAIQFDNWATKSAQNGDITRWIEEGVQSLKDMWDIGGSTIRMFQAINDISLAAGGATLSEFADNWSRIADMMNGEPFKSRMTTILKGARDGASLLNVGFKDLATSVGEASGFVATLLTQLGSIGGKFLSNVSVTIDNKNMQSGITAALSGIEEMVGQLRPSFDSLGDIIGGIGTIAGSVFGGMAPLINTVVVLVGDLTTMLSDNLAGVSEALLTGMNGRITALVGPIQTVAGLLNGLLGFFNDLPGGIQSTIVAFGVFLLMRGQLSKMMEAISNIGPFAKMRDNWVMAESAAGRYGTAAQRQFTVTGGLMRASSEGIQTLAGHWRDFSTRVEQAGTPMRRAGVVGGAALGGLRGAAVGLSSFLGGPLGVAFAGASIAASLFGEHQAEAKAKVDNLASSLEAQSGKVTEATKAMVAKDFLQQDTNWWDDMVRGAEKAGEGVKDLGLTSEAAVDLITQGGPAYDSAIEKFKLIRDNIGVDPQAAAAGYVPVQKSLEELSEATGYTVDELQRMDRQSLSNVITQFETGRDRIDEAQQKVKDLATATGLGIGAAGNLSTALQVIGDKAGGAAKQIEGIKDAMDILKGGAMSEEEAARAWAKSWDSALGSVKSARQTADANGKTIYKSLDYLVDAKGKIKDLHGLGGVVYDAATSIRDATLLHAQTTYNAVMDATGDSVKATDAALEKLKLTPGQIAQFAADMGIEIPKAKALLSGMFNEDWEMKALFSGNGELFFKEKARAEAAGEEFGLKEWNAFLLANGQQAVDEAKRATEAGTSFSIKDYEAQLKALPEPALAMIAKAVGAGDGYKRGDYSGILKAIDGTNPGVMSALLTIAKSKGPHSAEIQAFLNELTRQTTETALNNLANAKRQAIIDVFFGPPQNEPPAMIRRPTSGPGSMNGSLIKSVTDLSSVMSGAFPMQMLNLGNRQVKAFANGGFENHIAQIAQPRKGVVRIWGEEETGGEAYIPLSVSKRGRSTQILNEVARQFGFKLSRVDAYENGGVVGGGSRERTGQVAVNIDSYIQQSNDTADDVARAIMRRVKSRGTYSPLEGF